jgi:hypothetical protein
VDPRRQTECSRRAGRTTSTCHREEKSHVPHPDPLHHRRFSRRGHVAEGDIEAVKSAGYDDAQVVEIVAHVALNTLTNYINSALATDVDFPRVTARAR